MRLIRKKGITHKQDILVLIIAIIQITLVTIVFRPELRLLNNAEQLLVIGLPIVMIVTWIFTTIKIDKTL